MFKFDKKDPQIHLFTFFYYIELLVYHFNFHAFLIIIQKKMFHALVL